MNDFAIGLQVTALGMGLVFLTLVIVMLAIMALDRAFRPKPSSTEVADEPVIGAALPVTPAVAAEATREGDALDEATAIGVAIAAAVAARASARPVSSPRRSANPLFAMPDGDDVIAGEVVLVATVDGGSGVWSHAGRLQAMN